VTIPQDPEALDRVARREATFGGCWGACWAYRLTALLNHVREFVGEKVPARGGPSILASSEEDVIAHGEGTSGH
jgi:hypothetical protein